ncbi:MAG: helix-turn-helix domain-containing protein [Nanoarchaeota archaeon]
MVSFEELGLSPYENKIYTALLEYGRLSAKQIAERSKVPVTAVYPNLKKLMQKNLIQEFSGETAFFEPIDPKVSIPALIQAQKYSLEKLEIGLTSQAMDIYHHKQIAKAQEVLNVSLGKEASSAIYLDALARAEKTYYILGWTFKSSRAKFVKLHQLLEAVKRNIDVRIIVTGSEDKQWPILEEYIKQGINLRFYPSDNFSLLIADNKECKITLKNPEYDQKFNLHIKDPSLSEALQSYFLSVWDKAEPIKRGKQSLFPQGS